MNSNICVHETPGKVQCLQRRWKKNPTKRNVGEKSEAYYKVMGIYETKLKRTPGVKNSTRRKKGHYSSDKTEKSMSWEMLISKQAEG